MVTEGAFRTAVLSLPHVTAAPHFDRLAYRRRIIFASLAADGASANLLLPAQRQLELIARFPQALQRVANKWGSRGWTSVNLKAVDLGDIEYLLKIAFEHAA